MLVTPCETKGSAGSMISLFASVCWEASGCPRGLVSTTVDGWRSRVKRQNHPPGCERAERAVRRTVAKTNDPSSCSKHKQRRMKTRPRQIKRLGPLLNAGRVRMSFNQTEKKEIRKETSGVNAVLKLKPPCLTPCAVPWVYRRNDFPSL